jgi:hypothetical protein
MRREYIRGGYICARRFVEFVEFVELVFLVFGEPGSRRPRD